MVRERLVPVQERTLFLVKAILRTLPIRRPWIRQSLAPRRSCIVWPLLAKQYVFSLFVQVRSLRKENMCLMVKAVTQTAPDAEIGWSRRRHASRRRSGGGRHTYTHTHTHTYTHTHIQLKHMAQRHAYSQPIETYSLAPHNRNIWPSPTPTANQ